MPILSLLRDDRVILTGLSVATAGLVVGMWSVLKRYRDDCVVRPVRQKTQYITQETEDSLPLSTLNSLLDHYNHSIRETAAKIVCERAANDGATMQLLLWGIAQPDYEQRMKNLRALVALTDQNCFHLINIPTVYSAFVRSLELCADEVHHNMIDDLYFEEYYLRDISERLCLMFVARLATKFDAEGLVRTRFVERWLARQHWGDTPNERYNTFSSYLESRTNHISEICLSLCKFDRGIKALQNGGMIPPSSISYAELFSMAAIPPVEEPEPEPVAIARPQPQEARRRRRRRRQQQQQQEQRQEQQEQQAQEQQSFQSPQLPPHPAQPFPATEVSSAAEHAHSTLPPTQQTNTGDEVQFDERQQAQLREGEGSGELGDNSRGEDGRSEAEQSAQALAQLSDSLRMREHVLQPWPIAPADYPLGPPPSPPPLSSQLSMSPLSDRGFNEWAERLGLGGRDAEGGGGGLVADGAATAETSAPAWEEIEEEEEAASAAATNATSANERGSLGTTADQRDAGVQDPDNTTSNRPTATTAAERTRTRPASDGPLTIEALRARRALAERGAAAEHASRGSRQSRPHSTQEELRIRRQHREAMVLNDGTRPLRRDDIFQRSE